MTKDQKPSTVRPTRQQSSTSSTFSSTNMHFKGIYPYPFNIQWPCHVGTYFLKLPTYSLVRIDVFMCMLQRLYWLNPIKLKGLEATQYATLESWELGTGNLNELHQSSHELRQYLLVLIAFYSLVRQNQAYTMCQLWF